MEEPIKILIVEDNVIIADDMQSMLEEIGYEIVDLNEPVFQKEVSLNFKEADLQNSITRQNSGSVGRRID